MSVRMRHDGIEQEIEVAEISVRQYQRSGWQVVKGRQPGMTKPTVAKARRAEREAES
ncbi:hypothetical protein [Streptomyces sp. AVP053U2]|uniref:hypothetical protein n=1 Tax=Streptomyces sp. AVP053U2 TaxID=1737066 RepID=UPI00073BE745|nr:hypothetical protein [Streptomyces sp. AVP053U2]ODA69513.1 hypothetical protein APS67_006317 [Streptomyces sp. AVP053U2]